MQQPAMPVRGRWYLAAVVSVALSYLLLLAMQILERDWLPPRISISQYGVGPWGWVFSLFLITFALAPLFSDRALPSGRVVRTLLVVGLLGCLVMALVPTDPGGLQQSFRAKVHMVGAVFGLSMTPLGAAGAMLRHRRVRPAVPLVLAAISVAAIALLLVTAAGIDTLGQGQETSWAIWQTVAAVADIVLVGVLVLSHRPDAATGRPTRAGSAPPRERTPETTGPEPTRRRP